LNKEQNESNDSNHKSQNIKKKLKFTHAEKNIKEPHCKAQSAEPNVDNFETLILE